MHLKDRKETTKAEPHTSNPVLLSNLKKKQTKMTQQQPTGLHKTPKPRAQSKSGSYLSHQTHGTKIPC